MTVSGHAGYAPYGEDIVCASVTSALQLTANGVTEILDAGTVRVEENEIFLTLTGENRCAFAFLQALHLHVTLLQQEYPEHIQLTVMEV